LALPAPKCNSPPKAIGIQIARLSQGVELPIDPLPSGQRPA
jgi:hypothetical protein